MRTIARPWLSVGLASCCGIAAFVPPPTVSFTERYTLHVTCRVLKSGRVSISCRVCWYVRMIATINKRVPLIRTVYMERQH